MVKIFNIILDKKQKDMIMNLENKVSELEKEREVIDSLNSVAVDSILREKELLADSLNYALSDIELKFSREKQLLADSLTQYQVEFAHSLNKAKQAYNDSIQENRDSQAIDKHYNEGKRQFDNKNYNLAIKSFNQALNIDNTDILSHYYRGWANYYKALYNEQCELISILIKEFFKCILH